jgi:hypothetical protein
VKGLSDVGNNTKEAPDHLLADEDTPEAGWRAAVVQAYLKLVHDPGECWRGDGADSGSISGRSWDAVTIAWDNGQVATVHHGDMRQINSTSAKLKGL